MNNYKLHNAASFKLNVHQDCVDDTLINICCDGKDNTIVPFTPVRSSPFTDVYHFVFNDKAHYYKSFLGRAKRDHPAIVHFRGTRSARTLKAHQMLAGAGFFAPKIIIEGQHTSAGDDFILTEAIEHAIRLDELVEDDFNGWNKTAFIESFGRQIGRLHAKGVFHGDLFLGNVFVKKCKDDSFEFIFIDNERTRRHWFMPPRKRLKNLVQINLSSPASIFSLEDRLLFLKAYFSENASLDSNHWIKKVAIKTGKRRANTAKRLLAS